METVTIPKKLASQGDLVLIPRRDYERLLAGSSDKVGKRNPKIDRELAISMREFKEGKVEGPFDNADDFMSFLRLKPRRSRSR